MSRAPQQEEVTQVLPTIIQVKEITNQYDRCNLECDGLTNVLHFKLNQAGIQHTTMQGSIKDVTTNESMTFHRWITLETQEGRVTVDYRARMWLGKREGVPHGVFLPREYEHIKYYGREIELPVLPKHVIQFLTDQEKTWIDEARERNPQASAEWINEFRAQADNIARPMQPNGKRMKPTKILTKEDWDAAAEATFKAMK